MELENIKFLLLIADLVLLTINIGLELEKRRARR
jgi:hypothetical protein